MTTLYYIKNKATNKFYVGITNDYKERIKHNLSAIRNNRFHNHIVNKEFQNADLEYGILKEGNEDYIVIEYIAVLKDKMCYNSAEYKMPIDNDHIKKFFDNITKEPGYSGCWNWNKLSRKKNSPVYSWYHKGKTYERVAARIAYFIQYGFLIPELAIKQTCGNPNCVNPKHLKWGI